MNDCSRCPFDSFKGFTDNMFSRLCQNLNRHVRWNQILFNQCSYKFIFCLRSCRKSYLNLFKPNLYKQLKKLDFLFQTHRDHESLITVTQVNAAPDRGFLHRILLCPFHAANRRHIILFYILFVVHHNFCPPVSLSHNYILRNKKSLSSLNKRRKTYSPTRYHSCSWKFHALCQIRANALYPPL